MKRSFFIVACLLSLPAAAWSQETDADRLKRLEETVKKQQEQIDKLKPSSVTTSLTEGLKFRSADGQFDIHVGGRFHEHVRVVTERPDSAKTTPDTFFVRAARLQVDGTFYKEFGFIVQTDLASSAAGAAPTLQAAYLEWKRIPEFRLLFGNFKSPASQERLTSRLFSDFVEDSILTRFVPGYDVGVMAHGKLIDDMLGYQLALTNGRSHLDNQGRVRNDDNDEKELVARVTFAPWTGDKESPLNGFRFGMYGSLTNVDRVAISGAGVTTFDITTPELGITLLDPGAGQLDGNRTRFGIEISFVSGPASIRAEFLNRRDGMITGATRANVATTAWYVSATWLLTGETRQVEARIVPKEPFLANGGAGAVELALRVAGAKIDSDIEDILSLTGQTGEVRSVTFGANWWLTRNVRVSANVVQEDYQDEIDFGGGNLEDTLTGFLMRFQIDF